MFIYYIYEYGLNQKRIKAFRNNKKALDVYEKMDHQKYGFDYEYIHDEKIYHDVYKNLLDGYSYSDGFHGFKILNTYNDSYIIYNSYGSSAVSISLENVRWLLNKIFMDGFYKLKLCKNGYVNMI